MDQEHSDERTMLAQAVDRLVADHYGFDQRKQHLWSTRGWAESNWTRLADMGLLGLPFSEEDGGVGYGPPEIGLVMGAFGRCLLLEPFLSTVVLGGHAISQGGTHPQRQSILKEVSEGRRLLAFAHSESGTRYATSHVKTVARPTTEGWTVNGAKCVVLHGDSADTLLVSARIDGAETDSDGLGLFLVDAKAPGVAVNGYFLHDGSRAADVLMSNVALRKSDVLGEPGAAIDLIESTIDHGIAAVAAETVGILDELLAITIEYLKTRVQFGKPLSTFQALQHRLADMYVAIELLRSMASMASLSFAEPCDARRKAIAATKIQTNRAARLVGREAIQMHGGMGMTEDCKVGHYFRRLSVIETLFGDTEHHVEWLGRNGGLINQNDD